MGSEMCIRDSGWPCEEAPFTLSLSAARRHLAPAAARARGYLGGSSATQQLSRSRGSQELVAAQAAQSGADSVTAGEGRRR